ncbi:hypothetical protein KKB18_00910 [bacterium]|nr:hypothetical protein [bacterium]
MESLQEQINQTKKGGILEIPFGEFHETLLIKKPITIKANRIPMAIAGPSPTVTIASKNVILENVHIVSTDNDGICLLVKKDCNPKFNNVDIRGKVEGLKDEEGEWEIPNVLELDIIPNKRTLNKFICFIPIKAKIYPSEIEDITCSPNELDPGLNEVEIIIDEIREGSLIAGDIVVETLRYKLKRKISLNGNTLDSNKDTSSFDGKVIWECKSGKVSINLPEGEDGKPYEFYLDLEKLKCEGDNIVEIDGLPEGLSFRSSVIGPAIEGIPKGFGSFDLKFKLQKDGKVDEYPTNLIIKEKVIIPLKIEKLPDPVAAQEDEEINIRFKIVSSNSPDITYRIEDKLPGNLSLDDSSGELHGKISEHGKYKIDIKVGDGTNEKLQHINLYVHPKKLLKLNIEDAEVYKDEEFVVPVNIDDAERLFPKIKLKNQPKQISFDHSASQIKGKFTETKNYFLDVEAEDTYKRKTTRTVCLKCIEKPSYTIEWITPTKIEQEGKRGNGFTEQVQAKIVEDPGIQLKYSCMNNLPENFKFTESGFLEGIIDGRKYPIKIKAEYEKWGSEKEFNIITIIRASKTSSRIISGGTPGKIFDKYKKNSKEKETISSTPKKNKIGSAFEKPISENKSKTEKVGSTPKKREPLLGGAFDSFKKTDS